MIRPKKEGELGFRDLYSFNMVMLAKQVWRLLQPLDLLYAQVLRAKYYPDGDLLSAQAKSGISYVWRSILKGVEMVKKGMIWRVGGGDQIRIWEDTWIPRGATRRRCSVQGNFDITRVCELLDPVRKAWNEELVFQTLGEEDGKLVLCIPVCDQQEDFIAWHFDSKGLFTVKSAYKVHRESLLRRASSVQVEGSHSVMENSSIWSNLWSIECPAKVCGLP